MVTSPAVSHGSGGARLLGDGGHAGVGGEGSPVIAARLGLGEGHEQRRLADGSGSGEGSKERGFLIGLDEGCYLLLDLGDLVEEAMEAIQEAPDLQAEDIEPWGVDGEGGLLAEIPEALSGSLSEPVLLGEVVEGVGVSGLEVLGEGPSPEQVALPLAVEVVAEAAESGRPVVEQASELSEEIPFVLDEALAEAEEAVEGLVGSVLGLLGLVVGGLEEDESGEGIGIEAIVFAA
jgi:hypothetical protein